MAKIEGLQAGCIEAMMLNQKGEVAECTGDNIFIVKNGVVKTPPLNAGILEGITRDTVIDLARAAGREVQETAIERHDVYVADEVFLTGSAAEVVPVVKVDSRPIGEGVPGPVTLDLMKRFRSERPADICFARGTFNAHPHVMGAMSVFLEKIETPEIASIYDNLETTWNQRRERFNQVMTEKGLPLRAANMSSVWSLYYTDTSRYNWMLQYYLRSEGLALSWVGTGRLIFSLNYSDADFEEVLRRFVAACESMKSAQWFWAPSELSNKLIRRSILKEMFQKREASSI
jgi:glutamate-1-semialdehyde 2,1-aminomutase